MIYKVGDWVQFQVDEIDHAERAVRLDRSNHWVKEAYVELAPLPDPHLALKDAVVDAAIAWEKYGPNGTFIGSPQCRDDLVKAVAALREAQRPPSKFAALRKVWDATRRWAPENDYLALEAELAKLETEERNNAL